MQSEYGDLYKVTVSADGADKGRVTELKIKYFDTLPPCTSVCVLRTGFLFAASEFGNHALYQFQVPAPPRCSSSRRQPSWALYPLGVKRKATVNIAIAASSRTNILFIAVAAELLRTFRLCLARTCQMECICLKLSQLPEVFAGCGRVLVMTMTRLSPVQQRSCKQKRALLRFSLTLGPSPTWCSLMSWSLCPQC